MTFIDTGTILAFFLLMWFVKLVVDDTVDGKDNLDKKTREVADIRMYHFGWNFLQLGCDMLW